MLSTRQDLGRYRYVSFVSLQNTFPSYSYCLYDSQQGLKAKPESVTIHVENEGSVVLPVSVFPDKWGNDLLSFRIQELFGLDRVINTDINILISKAWPIAFQKAGIIDRLPFAFRASSQEFPLIAARLRSLQSSYVRRLDGRVSLLLRVTKHRHFRVFASHRVGRRRQNGTRWSGSPRHRSPASGSFPSTLRVLPCRVL